LRINLRRKRSLEGISLLNTVGLTICAVHLLKNRWRLFLVHGDAGCAGSPSRVDHYDTNSESPMGGVAQSLPYNGPAHVSPGVLRVVYSTPARLTAHSPPAQPSPETADFHPSSVAGDRVPTCPKSQTLRPTLSRASANVPPPFQGSRERCCSLLASLHGLGSRSESPADLWRLLCEPRGFARATWRLGKPMRFWPQMVESNAMCDKLTWQMNAALEFL
jgi:hypothetical protein